MVVGSPAARGISVIVAAKALVPITVAVLVGLTTAGAHAIATNARLIAMKAMTLEMTGVAVVTQCALLRRLGGWKARL